MKKYLFFLMFVCSGVMGQTVLFQQDFNGSGPFTSSTPNNNQFDVISGGVCQGSLSNGNSSAIVQNGLLEITAIGGITNCGPPYYSGCIGLSCSGGANRSTPLSSSNAKFVHQKFSVSIINQSFASNSENPIGFTFGFGQFIRNYDNSNSNELKFGTLPIDFSSRQVISIYANNSGSLQSYNSPENVLTNINTGTYDVWIGNLKIADAVSIGSNDTILNTFYISGNASGGGKLKVSIDDILVESLVTINPPCLATNSLKSGNWEDPTLWSCGSVPDKTQDVKINTGHVVILNSAMGMQKCKNLTIEVGGLLQNKGSLSIHEN